MVPADLVRAVRSTFRTDFRTVYGQTESSALLTQHHGDDALEDIQGLARAAPAGWPLGGSLDKFRRHSAGRRRHAALAALERTGPDRPLVLEAVH